MKFTAAVALGFGTGALASASSYTFGEGFGTCTSSTCNSKTSGLGLGSSSSSTKAGVSTSTGTWETWSADPTKSATKSSSSSTSTWGTWSADPTKSATASSSSTTSWGTWSADPTKSATKSSSSSSTTSWGTWSADPTKSAAKTSSSSSTAWGSWSADPAKTVTVSTSVTTTVKAAVATTCGACTSYVFNGDSWGFPSCAGGSVAPVSTASSSVSGWSGNGWGSDPSKPLGSNSGFISTIATGQYPSTISQVTKTWSVWATGTSSPSTKSQAPVSDNGCNAPGSRDKWCGGLDINTDKDKTIPSTGNVCEYDWTISSINWDFEGTPRPALAVNDQVPGPAIVCNWGDTVKVTVHNALTDNATTIHWHGLRQIGTNDQDGVPGVTECGLAPGDSRVYQWVASSYGSSWYHSHFITQFADGIQGPIIIKGPTSADYDVDAGSVMISDLFNVTAEQEYDAIVHTGPLGTSNYMLNGHNTKPDLSAGTHSLWEVEAGKKYLFRFVNSAAQSGWRVAFDSHTMTVVAADFIPVKPYTTKFIDISLGQRYDVIIEANQPVGSYFLRAATQGACPSTCDNTAFGLANGILQYKGASDALPTSTPSFNPGDVAGICQDEPIASLVPVVSKTAGSADAFAAQASTLPGGQLSTVATADDGAVFRWYLNGNTMDINPSLPTLEQLAKASNTTSNTTFSAAENVAIITQTNQWVYFVIQNEFFAPHPMHLHGHDFSLLGQGQGHFNPSLVGTLNFASPPRRDTAMLAGQGYTVIGFETDNPGAWLLHCHIAWHASGGLAMQFLERPADIPAAKYALSDSFQGQCNKYEAYAATAEFQLLGGDSGLKVRREELAGYSPNVVRRSEKSSKRYLSHNLKRGLGDSHHQHGHY